MNDLEKINDADPFEEGLRQILSNSEPPAAKAAAIIKPPAENAGADAAPISEAVNRQQAEQRTLFWFKLIRLLSVVALVVFMALFVMRAVGNR